MHVESHNMEDGSSDWSSVCRRVLPLQVVKLGGEIVMNLDGRIETTLFDDSLFGSAAWLRRTRPGSER